MNLISLIFILSLSLGLAQDTTSGLESHDGAVFVRDANVPDLPFEDNPDPSVCGIPEPWNDDVSAFLTGVYEGELIQESVLLYDSHLRKSIVGQAPSGTGVEILLFQSNPVLNFYLVRTIGLDEVQEGWIPAPFLRIEQPEG